MPLRKPFVRVFDAGDFFFVVRIDRLLRLDACHSGLAHVDLGDRSFKFVPVNPDGGRSAVAVLCFEAVVFFKEGLVVVQGPAFLDAKSARRVGSDFDRGFDEARVPNGAGDLMRADSSTGEALVRGLPIGIALRMADRDKVSRRIRTFDRTGPDSEFVGSRRNVLGIGQKVETLYAPGEFQVGAAVIVRKFGVVL